MKKKLLFIIPSLCSGGAERSLITLLTLLAQTGRYEIDLLLFREEGLFLPAVPKDVKVIGGGARYAAFDGPLGGAVKTGLSHLDPGFVRDRLAYAKALKNGDRAGVWNALKKALPTLPDEYDAAIGYLEGNALYYAAERVRAKRRIGYVHNDYNKLGLSAEFDRPFVQKLDSLVTVSPACAEALTQRFPEAAGKLRVIENITSPAVLKTQASETPPEFESFAGKKLLTVAALRPQKGYDLALAAAEKLKRDGAAYKWFCIGTGELKEQIERQIAEKELTDHFILLGERANPYPYIAHCDVYVQPSHFEGKSIALDETKCFSRPIVATKFSTVFDQLTDGKTALLADMNGGDVAAKIETLLSDETLCEKLTGALRREKVGNEEELEKFIALIE